MFTITILKVLSLTCLLMMLLGMTVHAAENHVPVVSNVLVQQIDFDHVLIRYDVDDLDGDTLNVNLQVSSDGRKTFKVKASKLEGDIGQGIISGAGKKIVWTIDEDIPLHEWGENYVVRVLADDMVGFYQRINWQRDGADMVLITAGSFEMGDHLDNMQYALPVHTVELDAFYIDVHQVTVGQFKQFVQESKYSYDRWNDVTKYSPTDDHPMINVTWYDAMAYAKWAWKRLPTEAEWEYAARGGLVGKRYPWANEISHNDANYTGITGRDEWDKQTSPAGSFEANGYGLHDMAGNAWEWCLDMHDTNFYSKSPKTNPIAGHVSIGEVVRNYIKVTTNRLLRGGSWSDPESYLRVAYRNSYSKPTTTMNKLGFRCVSGFVDLDSFATLPPELVLEETIDWEKDGSKMTLIPAGSFEMGDHFKEISGKGWGDGRELPVHLVELDAFYMDVHQVTVGKFKQFLKDSGYDYNRWNDVAKYSPTDDHPMINVTWADAMAYAKWAGKRLPTEAEWEYAARGFLKGTRYVWGDSKIDKTTAHYDGWNNGDGTTMPVGSFNVNGYGLYDMAGNVWEWCSDWYDENYYSNSPVKNPLGSPASSHRVLRGGSFYRNSHYQRVAFRYYFSPTSFSLDIGFRCVSRLSEQ